MTLIFYFYDSPPKFLFFLYSFLSLFCPVLFQYFMIVAYFIVEKALYINSYD